MKQFSTLKKHISKEFYCFVFFFCSAVGTLYPVTGKKSAHDWLIFKKKLLVHAWTKKREIWILRGVVQQKSHLFLQYPPCIAT